MGVKLVASSGGSVEFVPTNTASNFTVTVPAKTGTMAMDGPAFSAYKSGNQNITSATYTKVTFDVEDFDTNSNFASSTFTPTVAGYYQINAGVYGIGTSTTYVQASIYKNGTTFKNTLSASQSSTNATGFISSVVYLNGTTDYVEIYASVNGTSPQIQGPVQNTYFNGAMVRSA